LTQFQNGLAFRYGFNNNEFVRHVTKRVERREAAAMVEEANSSRKHWLEHG
jgi:hypothetical protein